MKSFRLDPKLVARARKLLGAKDDTETVRVALESIIEQFSFQSWVKQAAGSGFFAGVADSDRDEVSVQELLQAATEADTDPGVEARRF